MPEPVVTTSERLFSEEVAIANAQDPLPPRDVMYSFNNGRQFLAPEQLYSPSQEG